jgi:hypothetical protein
MQNEQLLKELGISPLLAVDLLYHLDLNIDDINIPQNFVKLQSVIDFLKGYPEDTQRFLIKKATMGKQDKLKCMYEYSLILKDKKRYEDISEKIQKEKSAVELSGDLSKLNELEQRETEVETRLKLIAEEIEIYHK